jgi:hypothetical protein
MIAIKPMCLVVGENILVSFNRLKIDEFLNQ